MLFNQAGQLVVDDEIRAEAVCGCIILLLRRGDVVLTD